MTTTGLDRSAALVVGVGAGVVDDGGAWSEVRAASSVPADWPPAPKPVVKSAAATIAMTPAPTPAGIHLRPADRVATEPGWTGSSGSCSGA